MTCLYKIKSESNSCSGSGGKYNWVDHPEQIISQMYSVPRFVHAYVHTYTHTDTSTLQRVNWSALILIWGT